MPQISAATAKFSFANLSNGRIEGQENKSHYRKGQPGDWRNHFDSSHIDCFKKLYNPLLLKLGYETNEDWNAEMPPAHAAISEISSHEQGLHLFQSGKYEEAARLLQSALREQENAERWNDWATAEWFCGRTEQAELGYRRALNLEPDYAQAVLNLSVVMSTPKSLDKIARAANQHA
jgi:tetratricopeptide (TPR) repeat protein